MNKLNISVLFISGVLFAGPSFANGNYDLKCTLDDGDQMTVSHVSDTVYIAFLAPGDDPDEGGSVIKLDVPSGGIKEELSDPDLRYPYYTLTGTDGEIDGRVVVSYYINADENKAMTYFSNINNKGKEISKHYCKSDTIKIRDELTTKGIFIKNSQTNSVDNQQQIQKYNADDVIDINVTTSNWSNGTVATYWWKYNITSKIDGLKINGFKVNRGNCGVKLSAESESRMVMKSTFDFGESIYFNVYTNRDYTKCRPLEASVETNYGNFTYNFGRKN
ncbi:hypothetical protein I2494_11820 [Budviciaceae bacterium BWR-B9]|uniref:Uncharacterized protein n=1 Tax=Limnobaculum allomyrinae TaxID=2791986 RepID=A0ABS1IRM4_9GAMM|nr:MULTISPECIES: hypothetical protein [Limnobaculum]MBK5144397.1 hypothetical protein [Limnobaculum allomyrinae]MBV7691858.1 hypothetical protein [Limnobaculum sp. M2-1]